MLSLSPAALHPESFVAMKIDSLVNIYLFHFVVEHIQSHLSYPHNWVQLAAAQLFGLLFAAWQPEQLVAMETESQEYLAVDVASKVSIFLLLCIF